MLTKSYDNTKQSNTFGFTKQRYYGKKLKLVVEKLLVCFTNFATILDKEEDKEYKAKGKNINFGSFSNKRISSSNIKSFYRFFYTFCKINLKL